MTDQQQKEPAAQGHQRITPFVGARALKIEYAGLSPHQLRMKIVAYVRENDKLKKKMDRMASEAEEVKAIHKKNVELERECSQLCKIVNSVQAAVKEEAGCWIIGDGQTPGVLQDIVNLREERDRLTSGARGFAEMWRRVSPQEKRRVLAECEADGTTEIKISIDMSVRLAKHDTPERAAATQAKAEGRIVSFAAKGDRF